MLDYSFSVWHYKRMKAAAFDKMMAEALTTPVKTVAWYSRLLKQAGLMTTGAKGHNAPHMTPMDAARLTLAILTTDTPAECVERVRRFGQIEYSPQFRKIYRGYEAMQPHAFAQTFAGTNLEEVLAFIFGLPALIGIEKTCNWFDSNIFHLRVTDFEVLAELYQWKTEGGEIVGELVVPFKGDPYAPGFTKIKGGVSVERSISCGSFLDIGIGLMSGSQIKAVAKS